MSQMDLALSADVSARHICFLETGRARPSRAMVLRLAETLQMPLRERNALMVAAGFAPVFTQLRLDSAEMAPVMRALLLVLSSHEPFPAFVLDRAWNILLANEAHHRMLALMLPAGADPGDPVNVLRLVFRPDLLGRRLGNWDLVVNVLGHRLRRQLRVPDTEQALHDLAAELFRLPGVAEAMNRPLNQAEHGVLIPLKLEMQGHMLSWFSTIATLGTPLDITAEELRIESLFPADRETEELIRGMTEPSSPARP